MLYFTDKALNELRKKAEKEYPAECCGILLGYADSRGKTAAIVYPTTNAAGSDSRLHFSIDPTEILLAEMYAEQNHLEVVGFYHSHPDNEAAASAEDISYMIPELSYPIISVINGQAEEMRCYKKNCNEVLKVHMNGGEPAENVPRSLKEEGHEVLDLTENADGTFDLLVRKVGE